MLVGVFFFLPQGKQPDPTLSLRPQAVLTSFFSVLKQPQFLIYTLVGGIGTAAPFAYISGSPDVFMNIYKVSEQEYGWIFAFLAFAMIGSTQLNHILLKKFKSEQIVFVTLLYQTATGLLLVLGTWAGWYGQYSLILLMFIFLSGQGLVNPNASALSLAPFTRLAGSAADLMGSFRMGMGSLVSAAVSLLHNNTALPMVGMMALCAVVSLFLLLIGKRRVSYKPDEADTEEVSPVGI